MKRNVFIAFLLMIIMIVVAVPIGVNNSLAKERQNAQGSYYYDKTGFAIWQGLEARRDAAANLITVADNYKGENEKLAPLINNLERAVNGTKTYSTDYKGEGEANLLLSIEAKALADELEKTNLSEKDEKYPRMMIAEMDSQQDMITRSSYNDDARVFNEKLEKFPANVFIKFTSVKPLYIFE